MTYKTRQEVLRAAADWMDVCKKAGVEAKCKYAGKIVRVNNCGFDSDADYYEFPLALLEGKEVWVGSELYQPNGYKFVVEEVHGRDSYCMYPIHECTWNPPPPKPKTVMVEMLVEDANEVLRIYSECFVTTEKIKSAAKSISTALENLK